MWLLDRAASLANSRQAPSLLQFIDRIDSASEGRLDRVASRLYDFGMTSLRARLFGVWMLSLAASLAVGWLLVQLTRQSSDALIDRADAELVRACDRIADNYAYYITGWAGPVPAADDAALQRDLDALAEIALQPTPGLGGGVLREPASRRPQTAASRAASEALSGEGVFRDRVESRSRITLLAACRLPGPIPDLAAWVATDVEAAPVYGRLRIGLGVLMTLMLGLSGGLTWLVLLWSRRVRHVEEALERPDGAGLPHIASTGEAELDRIINALNLAGDRLRAAQREAEEASARAAAAERLATLGRIAAGVAHEIRNPLATMRLRAEGALALDAARETGRAAQRGQAALSAILGQIGRLDRLSGELLTMTRRRTPQKQRVDLASFLASCAADADPARTQREADPGEGVFDPEMIRRVLDNLAENARRHAGPDGLVWLRARHTPDSRGRDSLRFEVEDNGPGVAPELHASLFEPFVTGRADGTGLGLAIAREMAEAHGGTLEWVCSTPGALFVLTLPQEPT
jgi:signal transduction histidine kinase